jgi:hypothetical protein
VCVRASACVRACVCARARVVWINLAEDRDQRQALVITADTTESPNRE